MYLHNAVVHCVNMEKNIVTAIVPAKGLLHHYPPSDISFIFYAFLTYKFDLRDIHSIEEKRFAKHTFYHATCIQWYWLHIYASGSMLSIKDRD
jgi:hypothetical protein